MNMQNIQILVLLLDSVVMLAPWRIVTKTMDRIGYAAGRSFARNLGIIAVFCVVLYVFPPVSILGAIMGAGDLTGAMVSHLRIGGPLINIMRLGLYLGLCLGVPVWGGLWLWRRGWRALMPPWSGFYLADH